tara:strand:- start:311 stop:922 length:612 start_codon:yes stop_codon:yes gene_type:complete
MKKLILILCVSFFTLHLSAQDFGVKGGLSFAYMGGENAESAYADFLNAEANYFNPGFAVGGFAQFGKSNMRFTAEVLYLQKGCDYSSSSFTSQSNTRRTLNYIQSNAMGSFYLTEKSSINGGVYLGYLESETYIFTIDGYSTTSDVEFTDEKRRVDYGVNVGFTLYLTEALQLDARYGHGLLGTIENYKVFNQTIQFTCGLKL